MNRLLPLIWAVGLGVLTSLPAYAQTYPSPTFNNVTVNGLLNGKPVGNGTASALHAVDFGAATSNTGAQNNTALQSWLNACHTSGTTCFLDAGHYTITATLTDCGVHITGAGKEQAVIELGTTTMNGLDVSCPMPSIIEHIGFGAIGTQGGGAAITVSAGGSSESDESLFQDLTFTNVWNGIHFLRASYWTLSTSWFNQPLGQAIIVENQNNADAGDSTITGNVIAYAASTNNSNQVGLQWFSSGGLRVINNKFVNGFRCAQYNLAPAVNTGTLLFNDNSCENFFDTGIFIQPQTAGSGTMSKMGIVGNEFLGFGAAYGIRAFNSSTPSQFTGLTIVGNTIQINGLAAAGVAPHGIDLAFVTTATITGNTIWCGGAGTGSIGVFAGGNVVSLGHSGNNITGCTTNVADSSITPPTAY